MSDIPVTPSLNTQLADAVAAVAQAHDYLNRMRDLHARALRDETDAINKVREAQQHFDALVAEVKKSAPRDTDWKRRPAGDIESLKGLARAESTTAQQAKQILVA